MCIQYEYKVQCSDPRDLVVTDFYQGETRCQNQGNAPFHPCKLYPLLVVVSLTIDRQC